MTVNVHRIAATQGGHVTRQQLLRVEMLPRTLERWIANGHLIRVYRGVYAVGHLPTNPLDRARGALLAAGPRSALSHECALVLWGYWKRWPRRLTVTLADDRRPSGLVVHHAKTLRGQDVVTVHGLRVTAPPRTALDFAATASPKQLHGAVDHLRLRHALSLPQLSDIIDRNPRHPGSQTLRALIGIAAPNPSRSGFERRWSAFAKRYGIGPYETNVQVAGFEVDVLIDEQLVIELDTFETHLLNFETDRERDATILATTGIPTIRVTHEQFVAEPRVVAKRISAARTALARSPSARAA